MIDQWKKKKQLLETTASTLLQETLRSGAEKVEVCLGYGAKTKIGFEKGDFQLASSDDGIQYGVRALVQSRQGFVSGNSTEKQDLKDIAQTAVRIAKVSPPNEFNSVETSENIARTAPDNFWDDALIDLSLSTQREWAKAFVGETLKEKRFRLNEGTLALDGSLFLVSNSVGTHKFHRETSCSWSLMGLATENEKITSFDYFSEMTRSLKPLPDALIHSAAQFRDSVVANLKTGPAKSYLGTVVFSPRAVLDIFLRPLLYHLNGRTLVEGAAKWQPAELGKEIVSPMINILDTPWNTGRFGASTFDREGNPTAEHIFIQKGKMNAFYLDNYSAKALKMRPTGNAVGGPGAIPSAGIHNVKLQPGTIDLPKWMLSESTKRDGMLVVNRFSGRTDPTTGDFSGVAKGAEWWVRGERAYFVQDTLVSGNIFETLSKGLIGLSQQSIAVDASGDSPSLIADGISVTSTLG